METIGLILMLSVVSLIIYNFAASYRRKLANLASQQRYSYSPDRTLPVIGKVENYYFMPFFPFGYYHMEDEQSIRYLYITNQSKYLHLTISMVSKKTFPNYDFELVYASWLHSDALKTGVPEIDKVYAVKGSSAQEIVDAIKNTPSLQNLLLAPHSKKQSFTIAIKNGKLHATIAERLLFFPKKIPDFTDMKNCMNAFESII